MKKIKTVMSAVIALILLIGFDQWTKHMAVIKLKGQAPVALLEGIFELSYTENKGAAFGLMQDQRLIFLICTVIILAVIIYLYFRIPVGNKRFLPLRFVGICLTAGAIGNMIDRMVQGYVVDFLYFKLIDFPLFNVADCYVVVSTILLVILMLFFYKEEELDILLSRKQDAIKEKNKG